MCVKRENGWTDEEIQRFLVLSWGEHQRQDMHDRRDSKF